MRILLLLGALCCWWLPNYAIVVGSNTAVSQQAKTTFPTIDVDNEMRGFAAFADGFTLENSSATCIFNALYPIGGTSRLNGGTLNLSKDIFFEDTSALTNVGTINGNNYSIQFTTTAKMILPSGVNNIGGLVNTLSFFNEVSAGAAINSVHWSYDSAYVAAGIASVTGNDFRIYNFNGTTLSAAVAGVDLTIAGNCVRWHPSKHWVALATARVASTSVHELRLYSFNTSNNTLTLLSSLDLNLNGKAVAWSADGTKLAVTADNSTANVVTIYSVNQSTGALTQSSSLVNAASTPVFSNNALSWNPAGTHCAAGIASNSSLAEFRMYTTTGTAVVLNTSVELATTVAAVAWHPTLSYVAVGLSGTTQRLRIYEYNVGASTLTDKTTAYVGETTANVLGLAWSPDGTKLCMGRATNATGTELRTYAFDSSAVTLTLLQQLDFSGNINAVAWSPNGLYIASGGTLNNVAIHAALVTETLGSFLTFNNCTLTFNTDVALSQSLRFQGFCKLDMQGHALDLGSTYSIAIAAGSSLLLENTTLSNIGPNNIVCLDNVATVSLANVHWQQSADTSYTAGRFDVIGDLFMHTPYQFSYLSTQSITMGSYSRWFFGPGSTLNYNPANAVNSLLTMQDSTAQLSFIDATCKVGAGGLQLKKGRLTVEGLCPFISSGTSADLGLTIGDGVSSANDVTFKVLGESLFDVQSGFFVVNNVVP